MFNIKDKYFSGIMTGILINIPINILDYIFYLLNINQYHMWQIAASAYFRIQDVDTVPALIVGAISDYSTAILLAITIVYLLSITGTDYFWAKGLSVGGIWWLFAFGVMLRIKIGRIDPIDAGTNLYHVSEHMLFGVLVAWIITKYGQEALAE
ncbi:hypothetical protein [Acetohalobium arabaticum]|uniref:Uncharacterized protein n=1 Tax=Acetohalobium arabaticum (strain ATCC 49924 / DSM 5501 / Z-7288) TaxID=574087 RepID=D9QRB2_ACEAZ|nr:hypothetical protein [Acetohalobium arabaticum]ADL13053.1 conserved hypothetical protein [Acetohalobium arabaticum DSM 5501]